MGSWTAVDVLLCVTAAAFVTHCSAIINRAPINTIFSVVENQTEYEEIGRLMYSGGERFRFRDDSAICNNFFTINENTSMISTVGLLDREAAKARSVSDTDDVDVQCLVQYTNKSTGIVENIRITIHIFDINDETPSFHNLDQPHIVRVVENVAPPTPLLRLEPIDNDRGMNGTVHFNITSGDMDYFTIMKAEGDTSDTTTRILFLQRELDFETHNRVFNLTVRIWDMGSPTSFSYDQEIMVVVSNSLIDEPPTFPTSRFEFDISEDQPVGITHPFANVTAANTDEVLGSIFYYLCEGPGCERVGPSGIILVNEITGGLYLNSSLDYEDGSMRAFQFYVTARSPANGLSMNAFVIINVLDANDNVPYFVTAIGEIRFTQRDYPILENNTTQIILGLEGRDDDFSPAFATYAFSITSDPPIEDRYTFRSRGTTLRILTIDATFDREEIPNVTISINVRNPDAPHLNSTAYVNIYVEDVNDNAPSFTDNLFTAYAPEGYTMEKEVLTLTASDRDTGNNSDVTYNISSVDKQAAQGWFHISPATGVLTVASNDIDYQAVGGEVVLHVTATDGGEQPLSSVTKVEVKIVPATTFSARSHQAFANYNLAGPESYPVYLEFETSADDGILLYHQGSRFLLALDGRRVVLRQGVDLPVINKSTVLDNSVSWYSVSVEKQGQTLTLDVWKTNSRTPSTILTQGQVQNCTEERDTSSKEELLYVGGINPLLMTDGDSPKFNASFDFVGAIRNIVIGPSLINSRCPLEEQNTLIGVQRSSQCRDEELRCVSTHSTGCVDYAKESFCRCRGGFASSVCNGDSGQDSYAPIRLHGNGPVSMDLPYSFVYDLEMYKGSSGGPSNEPVVPGSATRKRRQISDPESPQERTLQRVEISFRPVDVGASDLLHTESKDFVHLLRIQETGIENAISYLIFDKANSLTVPRDRVLIPNYKLENGTEYHVTITFNSSGTTMTINDNVRHKVASDAWGTNTVTLFVEQPETTLSIGGAPDETTFFVGCIKSLTVDQVEIPLSGLASLAEQDGGFSYNATDSVEPFCDLCDLVTCQGNLICLSDFVGGTNCGCSQSLVLDEVTERCVERELPTDGLSTNTLTSPSIYIAGGTTGGVLLVAIMIAAIIITIRVQHVRYEKKKRTYSVTVSDGILPPQRTSKSGNDYVRVEPKRGSNAGEMTCIGTTCSRPESQDRGSSVSTFQEHADDGDPEIDEPPRLQRRKSTVSAESGIRTDTERDSSLRGASRMDDSGTDYTPQESESDDFASSCFMEPVNSPVGVHLVGSAGSVMGVPRNGNISLSPQERKAITPLRPDSIRLSMNEDERRDLDFDTDISSCNLQPVHKGCPTRRGSDSDNSTKISERGTPKWYKSSTASDNERESERALKNRAYYPPAHIEPPHYSHPPRPKTAFGGAAPDHVPPPSISTRKSASPVFPRSPSRRLPPTMISADSPLTRNTHKYENYPLPYSMHHLPSHPHPAPPPDTMRERGSRGAVPGYVNHHIQHQISAPGPQDHHSGQPDRHVYFAKSSQTLHYSRSVGREDYTPPQQPHSRQYYTLASAIPTSLQYRQNRSFSSGDAPPADREQMQFQDLKNVSTINPIAYWEMQDRLKPTVDQVDPYQVLSEPYIQFEDVSTDLSVTQSEATLHADNGPDHEVFESQGGGEGTADMGPGCLSRLQDHDTSSITTGDSQSISGGITHFPSADCSHEYTATINGTSSSGDSTPKFQPNNGFIIPSQQSFDV